jgi:plastocyanin
LLLGPAVALAAAAPAAAAEVQIQGAVESWSPATVKILPGDTVVWSFPNPTETHNVQADETSTTTTPWTFFTEAGRPAPPASFKFDTPGTYAFRCFVHPGMKGAVTVGDPPPPPPPPLSEQPFYNDSAITTGAFETGSLDTAAPRLRGVKAKKSRRRVKVSFRVSEQSSVTVRLTRRGKKVRTKKASTSRTGSVTVAGLKRGRYSVRVTATDVAGNTSRARRASFRIR